MVKLPRLYQQKIGKAVRQEIWPVLKYVESNDDGMESFVMQVVSASLNVDLDKIDDMTQAAILKSVRKKLADFRGNVLKALKKEYIGKFELPLL